MPTSSAFAVLALVPLAAPQERAEGGPRTLARLELSAPGATRELAIADADGDGRRDLLVGVEEPGRCLVWRGLGPRLADLRPPAGFVVPDYSLGPVVLAEADGRRALVLAFGDRASNEVLRVVLTAGADGALADGRETFPLEAKPRALCAVPDVAGEARLAVATEAPALELFAGATRVAAVPLGDGLPTCAAAVDELGWIAVGCQTGPSLRLVGPGADGAWSELGSLALDGIPRSILLFDLENDGDRELLVVGGDRSAWVYGFGANDGLELLLTDPEPLRWRTGAIPIDLDRADTDGDGSPELIAAHYLDQQLGVLADFDAEGPKRTLGLYGGPSPWSLASGDLDGDDRVDLAISNPNGNTVSLYFGDAEGLHEPVNLRATPAPHSMALGDLDGDGRPELALLSAIDAELALLGRRDGEPVLLAERPVPAGSDAVRMGDLDGDGNLDLGFVWAAADGGALEVWFGDGRGGLEPRGASSRVAIAPRPFDLELCDLDGDGRDEAVVSEAVSGKLVLVKVNERGELAQAGELSIGAGAGPLVAVHAKDGGFAGLAVGLRDQGGRFGAALFTPRTPNGLDLGQVGFVTTPRPPEDLTTADFDGDGTSDLAILMQGPHDNAPGSILVTLAPSEGEGGFAVQPEQPTGPKPFHVAAGDVDGDGCAELFATSQYANRVSAWRGQRSRTNALVPTYDLGANRGCMNVEVWDVDADGDLDVVVGNNHSGDVSFLLTE